jgi:hypothetical protein
MLCNVKYFMEVLMRVDPETTAGLLLRVGGPAAFLVLAAGMTAALLTVIVAVARHRDARARRAAAVGGALLLTYGGLLVAGPLLLGRRTLVPGQELAFCGFDCHLHLTATRVERRDGLEVTVRARSDARAVPEDPRYVTLSVIDRDGHRYAADSMTLDRPLQPGESYERTLRFAVPPTASALRLTGTWQGWLAYVIPGPDNIFVQRRTAIQLTPDSATAS